MLKDILTPKIRKILYTAYAIVALLEGATQVAFVAIAVAQPLALTAAIAVTVYLGIGLGFTAAANTPAETPTIGS